MSLFPATPSNGQQTTVNGIIYTYNSTQTAWIRTGTTISQGDLLVNGNLVVVGTSNLSSVSNVVILGGANGQVLTTNGTGTLSWTTPPGSAGGSPTVWVAATTNYTMNSSDDAVVSTATGNITVTLPNASTVKSYYFQNSSSNFLMTLQTVSSQLINNSSNLVIQFNGSSCRLISDGTKFYIF